MRTLLTLTVLALAIARMTAEEPLVVHEWGTFTSLQDEAGRTIGGINTDEESLPGFVYDLRPVRMVQHSDLAPRFIKFAPACAEEVTMRLETPVVYFHLPKGMKTATVDVKVTFLGGVLSQFYPDAQIAVDGADIFDRKTWKFNRLMTTTTSTLEWKRLTVGALGNVPHTTSAVWLAPRQVASAPVATPAGEHERYLFYRGLGKLDAPLVAVRSADGSAFNVSARPGALGNGTTLATIPRLWLADLRGDGTAAMRSVPAHVPNDSRPTSVIPATFAVGDYSADRLAVLQRELHAGLMGEGLHTDEATALLTTWQESYFKSPGLRLFFLVPRQWTDRFLPLTVTPTATVERAMMGRIELLSTAQRRALDAIAAGPASDTAWFDRFIAERVFLKVGESQTWRPGGEEIHRRLYTSTERGLLSDLKMPMPADYQAYLSLGRFRDALILDEQRQRPTAERKRFIEAYQLLGDEIQRVRRAANP
jgi:hypothetical protein